MLRLSGAYRIARRITRDALAVLTYHRVRADGRWTGGARHPNVVSTGEFDRQIAYLTRHHHVVDGQAVLRYLTTGAPLPANPVLITFDDGYRDNFTEALPVLRRRGVTATFFVSTGFVGGTERLWLDRLDAVVRSVGESGLTHWVVARGLPLELRAPARFRAWAKTLTRARRLDVVRDLSTAFRPAPTFDDDAPMSWDQVGQLAEAGMTIGSHTVTHQILGVASRQEVQEELRASREEIERRIGGACWAFSYPNGEPGDFRPSDMEDLRDSGYACAFTQISGFVTRTSNPYALPRIPVPAASALDVFQSRVSGVHAWLGSRRSGAVPA